MKENYCACTYENKQKYLLSPFVKEEITLRLGNEILLM
jgi:hypothetical protein